MLSCLLQLSGYFVVQSNAELFAPDGDFADQGSSLVAAPSEGLPVYCPSLLIANGIPCSIQMAVELLPLTIAWT